MSIRLSLTKKEAKVLNFIFNSIGGKPDGTRLLCQSMQSKLTRHYEKYKAAPVNLETNPKMDAIYFE